MQRALFYGVKQLGLHVLGKVHVSLRDTEIWKARSPCLGPLPRSLCLGLEFDDLTLSRWGHRYSQRTKARRMTSPLDAFAQEVPNPGQPKRSLIS